MIDKYYVYELWNPLNNQIFYVGLGTGIRAEKHFRYLNDSDSVSKGWKNRSKEEKKLTSQKRTNINLKNWQDPEMIKKFQKSVDKIGISVKITNNNGEIFYSRSLLSWCKKNKQSYCVLWDILKGKGPKPNKYKQSKYLNWKVEKHE